MKLSNKLIRETDIDKLLELLGNNYAYYTTTGSKVRRDNIDKIEAEIKRRIKEAGD